MTPIHRPTTDLLTAKGESYQVILPPDSRMETQIDVLRQLQPHSGAVHLVAREGGQRLILQTDNMVMKASDPHAPNYNEPLWECTDW